MDQERIIRKLVNRLKQNEIWFTTKSDPTMFEPSNYIELNKYGDLTEDAKADVTEQIIDLIGDGASTEEEAINLWIDKNIIESRLNYVDCLKTRFEPKPFDNQISAYESNIRFTESLEEPLTYEEFMKTDYFKSRCLDDARGRFGDDPYIDLNNDYILSGAFDDNMRGFYNDYIKYYKAGKLDRNAKPIRECKTESVKTRLNEENTKSKNIIADELQSSDFDPESNKGKIILRTSKLFDVLSAKGYNVQVSLDNGDSQNTIILNDQGGYVNITINDESTPLKAFTGGSFELTKSTLEILNDIKEQIKQV